MDYEGILLERYSAATSHYNYRLLTYHQRSLQLLGPLVVGRVQVDTVEPGVHAGVAETLDAQHRLLGGAEHREGLIVKLTLNKMNMSSG